MKVCILSDSHDHISLLDYAIAEAKERGAEAVIHCGDVVAPSTLKGLNQYALPVHVVHGNNTGDLYTLGLLATKPDNVINYHGMDAGLELGGKRIFLVHYPHYASAMAATGDWDLVCCGHSHTIHFDTLPNVNGGTTPLVNPGTVGGVGKSPATYVIADLDTMDFKVYEIPKSIELEETDPLPEEYRQLRSPG